MPPLSMPEADAVLTVTMRLSYVPSGLLIFRDEGAEAPPMIFQVKD